MANNVDPDETAGSTLFAYASVWVCRLNGLMLSTLGEISADDILKRSLIVLKKQVLTFQENCLQWRQFACNANPVFLQISTLGKIFSR